MRVAALTMAYNEPVWARVWARYYARQVGAAHCYLLDHGSDDGSTDGLEVNVERLGRTPLDEVARAATVSGRAAALLRSYDAVVHSDVDELVIADPERYGDLVAFAGAGAEPVITTAGLDLQHLPDSEKPLDPERAIGAQRGWARFSAAMCKPAFVRREVTWEAGFHGCDAPMVVGGLFLVHLRYADLALGLRRLARTRGQTFAGAEVNPHQRVSDAEFAGMMRRIAALPAERFVLDCDRSPLAEWLSEVRLARDAGAPSLTLAGGRLWKLPDRVRALF